MATPHNFASNNATVSSVASSNSSGVLLAANKNRTGMVFYNDSTATCYVAFAATASSTAFTKLMATNTAWEFCPEKPYTGIVSGIWASTNGNMRITELSG